MSDFLIIPAIDMMGGKVVRLVKGDMDRYTVYSDDPVDTAKSFIDMGVKRLHIVDLDGAKTGDTVNYKTVEKIASLGGLEIEFGGGLRDISRIDSCFNTGISYAILGTMIVKDPQTSMKVLEKYPDKIILGIDARKGMASVSGWYEDSAVSAVDLVKKYENHKAAAVIYTDIDQDGTLEGVNVKETAAFADNSPFNVIASGGVSSATDIRNLRAIAHPNITGCIVGKAFYEGKIDLEAEIKK